MKKLWVLISAALCAGVTVHAADEISVYVDGQKLGFEVQPQIINDYTMVPMRTIFERLGYTVTWHQETQIIEAVNYQINKGILLIVDVPQMIWYNCDELNAATDMNVFISNHTYNLDIAPTIVDDNTLVPLRAVSEASGAGVIWNGTDRAVYITMPEIEQTTPAPIHSSEPTATTEAIEESVEDKYYTDTDLLNYKYFSTSSLTKTKYGYNYYFDQAEFDDYIDSTENDGWTVEKPYERYNDLRLTKGEKTARIVWDNKYIVVIVDNEFLNSNMFAILNYAAEKMQYNEQIETEEKETEDKENNADIGSSESNSYKFVNEALKSVIDLENVSKDGAVISSVITGVNAARNDLEFILNTNKEFENYLNSLPNDIFQLIYKSAEDAACNAYAYHINTNNYGSSYVLSEAIDQAYYAYLNTFLRKYNSAGD